MAEKKKTEKVKRQPRINALASKPGNNDLEKGEEIEVTMIADALINFPAKLDKDGNVKEAASCKQFIRGQRVLMTENEFKLLKGQALRGNLTDEEVTEQLNDYFDGKKI